MEFSLLKKLLHVYNLSYLYVKDCRALFVLPYFAPCSSQFHTSIPVCTADVWFYLFSGNDVPGQTRQCPELCWVSLMLSRSLSARMAGSESLNKSLGPLEINSGTPKTLTSHIRIYSYITPLNSLKGTSGPTQDCMSLAKIIAYYAPSDLLTQFHYVLQRFHTPQTAWNPILKVKTSTSLGGPPILH